MEKMLAGEEHAGGAQGEGPDGEGSTRPWRGGVSGRLTGEGGSTDALEELASVVESVLRVARDCFDFSRNLSSVLDMNAGSIPMSAGTNALGAFVLESELEGAVKSI